MARQNNQKEHPVHIDYQSLLPASKTCEHLRVAFDINEPAGKPYVLVSVSCKSCPSAVANVEVAKD